MNEATKHTEGGRDPDRLTAALVALARHNVPPDVQELLVQGDPMRGIAPGALEAALPQKVSAKRVTKTDRFYGDPVVRFRAMASATYSTDHIDGAHFRMWCAIAANEIETLRAALTRNAEPSEPVGYLFELCYSHDHNRWSGTMYSEHLPNPEDIRNVRPLYATPPVAQTGTVGMEPDDAAVDRFADAMKAKLAKKRAEGRGGWDGPDCSAQILSDLLRAHVDKGDPLDVGNLAMMLHQRGERII